MYIVLKNGKRIYGRSWDELVLNLKHSTYFKQTVDEYMKGVAERAKIFDRSEIQYNNSETFLRELERIGIVSLDTSKIRRIK